MPMLNPYILIEHVVPYLLIELVVVDNGLHLVIVLSMSMLNSSR